MSDRVREAAWALEEIVDRLLEWNARENDLDTIDYPERPQEDWDYLIEAAATVLPKAREALSTEPTPPEAGEAVAA